MNSNPNQEDHPHPSNRTRRPRRTALQMVLDSNSAGSDASAYTRPRQRRRTRDNTSTSFAPQQPSLPVTPAATSLFSQHPTPTATSIRNNALYAPVGSDVRNARMYDVNYRHSNNRICYCDQPLVPTECESCSSSLPLTGEQCGEHATVPCCYPGCGWLAHVGCLKSYGCDVTDNLSQHFTCLKHQSSYNTSGHGFATWESSTNEMKCQRLGIPFDNTISPRAVNSRIQKCIESLIQSHVPLDIIHSIKNTDPAPYPDIVQMSDGKDIQSALCGRQYEVSMLQYKCYTCSCCGITCPTHSDPFFKSQPDDALRSAHLNMAFHMAWECNCVSVCKKQQFYGAKRPSIIACYTTLHNGRSPMEVIGSTSPNALLCNTCYYEFKQLENSRNNLSSDLEHMGHMFSVRNGFGGQISLPILPNNDFHHLQMQKAYELRELLNSFTSAEEAAIRQITPLLTIIKLSEGNIGTKGSSHLVWQRSNLSLILPNLPEQCKFIVIRRKNSGSRSTTHSTTFQRRKIQRALELLSATVPGVWAPSSGFNISYSTENLERWPESGDLAHMNLGLEVYEVDDTNNLSRSRNNQCDSPTNNEHRSNNHDDNSHSDSDADSLSSSLPHLRVDGSDAGPAPLQNADAPEEEFETVLNYSVSSTTANAQNTNSAVTGRINELVTRQNVHSSNIHVHMQHDTCTFDQPTILQTDGFVDMSNTPYAWARAFPTLFIPEYIPISSSEYAWVIRHDITGWHKSRDKKIDTSKWYQYMMWRHDGAPAKHATFSLALFNYKTSIALQQVGRHVINTSSIDPTITMAELREAHANNDTIEAAVRNVVQKAHLYSSSVPGTPRYWINTASEFFSIAEFNSHVRNKVPNFFITNSLADHHDFHLRLVLHNYLLSIHDNVGDTTYIDNPHNNVINSDGAFSAAAHTYKNVVTHFFASKVEVWYRCVLQPMLGIDMALLVHEFQTGRGAIHCHVAGYSEHEDIWNRINDGLFSYSVALHNALTLLDSNICQLATTTEISKLKLNTPKGGLIRRKSYLQNSQRGCAVWDNFISSINEAKLQLDNDIGSVLESEYGYNAMHHGRAPDDWVKPGGQPTQQYRSATSGMMSSKDVLERRELKHLKLQRENDTLSRRVNVTNHCLTHKCSRYCWKEIRTSEPYDTTKHTTEQIDNDSYIDNDGNVMIRKATYECRMGFGCSLQKDYSGENNLTGGARFLHSPVVEFDRNQMPKFTARRNHPRVINHPHVALYFGANNDVQPILINASFDKTMEYFNGDVDSYAAFFSNMNILGCGGLEHHNGLFTVLKYMTGYQCKGGKSTQAWDTTMQTLTSAYCNNLDNDQKTLRSLIGRHMHDLPKSTSVTRDQSQFLLGGGMLKRTSVGQIRKCSVSSEFLHNFGDEDNTKSFTWRNALRHYKQRSDTLNNVSLYRFCCSHWPFDSTERPVQFFGYHDKPSWPLRDKYSEWILTIYYPWKDTPEELCSPTFEEFLTNNYTSPHIPATVQSAISRARYNVHSVDMSDSYLNTGGVRETFTPTTGRHDERLNDTANVETFYNQHLHHHEYEDFSDDQFNRLPNPEVGSIDWRQPISCIAGFDTDNTVSWLCNERSQFYETLESNSDNHRTVCQFPLDEFCPEKAKGKKQKLIIYILLYQLYRYDLAERNGEAMPPSIFMFAEGLPGTGKSRMLKTMRNIVRLVKDSNYSELTSAPTGVAASLIEGTTHCRSCSIPTGKEFSKVPGPISCSKSSSLQHMLSMHRHLFLRAFDEHSMTGRKSFGWLKHRLEELRTVARTYDAAGNLVPNLDSNQPSIPDGVSFRPFGGVPFIFSCGDHAQLPPVLDKLMYDTSPAKPNTADMCGKIAFSQFLHSDDESEIESAVVILDEVLRQDDPIFLGFLQRMRGGNLNMDDVALIRSRCLETLDETEQAAFKDAIHITSTWDEASKISFEYLCRLNVPIAKIRARYSTSRNDGKNCCLKESSYPSRLALAVGAKVMLLKNFIVEEWHILNGSMGTVVDIIYDHKDGPMAPGNPLPLFVVVDFPSSNVPEGRKCFPNAPSSFVAIPVVCERCKNNCCSIETIPLRVCIAITIYKSQGITVGDGEMFEKIVVHLPMNSKRIVPGLELVAFSRAKGLECLAIGNAANDLVTDRLLKIGKSKGNQSYKDFMAMLANKEQQTFDKFGDMITKLDDSDGANEATFEGGCDFLLRWYHSTIDSNVP